MTWSAISNALRLAVSARDGGRCQYCGLSQKRQAARFHVDHIFPIARNGPTRLDNLATQCTSCSTRKSAKIDGIDPTNGARVPLFHPLRERWTSHFSLRVDGVLIGLTPTGRATINALLMNDDLRREAREGQIIAGLLAPTPPVDRP